MMERRVEIHEDEVEKTKKFVKKYWPVAMGIVGAAGVVGAAIWITARYLRENKKRDKRLEIALENIEAEVSAAKNEVVALLESGTYLGKVSGGDGSKAIGALSQNIESIEAKEAFEVLDEVIKIAGR